MIKSQDILVLAALMGNGDENRSYAKIADKAKLSVSESFAAANISFFMLPPSLVWKPAICHKIR